MWHKFIVSSQVFVAKLPLVPIERQEKQWSIWRAQNVKLINVGKKRERCLIITLLRNDFLSFLARARASTFVSEEIKDEGGILAQEEAWYAAFDATEGSREHPVTDGSSMASVTGLPSSCSQLMGCGGDENSAIVLAPHKGKWIGQIMRTIWTNSSLRLGENRCPVADLRLQTFDELLFPVEERITAEDIYPLSMIIGTCRVSWSLLVLSRDIIIPEPPPPPPEYLTFAILSAGLKDIGRELRSARSTDGGWSR